MPKHQTLPSNPTGKMAKDNETWADFSTLTNAETNHTVNVLFNDAQIKSALDALGVKYNALLAKLKE